jgi:hypothetical protein
MNNFTPKYYHARRWILLRELPKCMHHPLTRQKLTETLHREEESAIRWAADLFLYGEWDSWTLTSTTLSRARGNALVANIERNARSFVQEINRILAEDILLGIGINLSYTTEGVSQALTCRFCKHPQSFSKQH